jgi:hypothetical protein
MDTPIVYSVITIKRNAKMNTENNEEYVPYERIQYEGVTGRGGIIKTDFPIKEIKRLVVAYLKFDRDRYILNERKIPSESIVYPITDLRPGSLEVEYLKPYERDLMGLIVSVSGNEIKLAEEPEPGGTHMYIDYQPDIFIRRPMEIGELA